MASLWEGEVSKIFNSPQHCVAEILYQAITAEKSEAFFLYPAPTHRAETLLLEWQTENTGAPVALTTAHWYGKDSIPGKAI